MGCLKRIADKKWRIKYDVRPDASRRRKQKVETLVNVTRAQAEAILAERKRVVSDDEYIREDLTIKELFERFMCAKTRLAPKTAERYWGIFRVYIDPEFGAKRVSAIKQTHLGQAYAKWEREGPDGRKVTSHTIRHVHDLVRNMLNWSVRMEYAKRNVALLLTTEDIPKVEKFEITVLDELELRRLLSVASKPTPKAQERGTPSAQPWFCPAVWFAAYTGSRRGETLAIYWSDIDLETKEVTIRRSLSQTRNGLNFKSTKSGQTRVLAMPHKLVTVLREYQVAQTLVRKQMGQAYKDQDLVFALADGSPVQPWTFTAAFRTLVKRAGVKRIRLHDLRHTHISLLIGKAGVSLKMASSRAGHSTLSFTADRYSHVYRSEDAKAAKKFERLVG